MALRKLSDIDDAFGQSVRRRRMVASFALLGVLLVVLVAINLCVGSLAVAPADLWAVLAGQDTDSVYAQVVWSVRMPRLIAAALLGGALALAGFLLQTFFNNPIAGPYILGISSGAKLVVALMMIVVIGASQTMPSWLMVVSAFVAAYFGDGIE